MNVHASVFSGRSAVLGLLEERNIVIRSAIMFYTEERHYSLQTDPVDKLSITNKKTTVVIAVA